MPSFGWESKSKLSFALRMEALSSKLVVSFATTVSHICPSIRSDSGIVRAAVPEGSLNTRPATKPNTASGVRGDVPKHHSRSLPLPTRSDASAESSD